MFPLGLDTFLDYILYTVYSKSRWGHTPWLVVSWYSFSGTMMFNDTLSQRALQSKRPVISQVTAKLFALCNLHTCLFVCQIYSFPISSGIWLEHDSSNTKHVSIKSTLPALIEECRNRRLEGLDFKTKAFQIGRRAHTLSSGGGRRMASLRLTHLASETLSWNRSENKIKKKSKKPF